MNKQNESRGWADMRKDIFTKEELAEADLRVALICELINARKEKGITQAELEAMTGIKQPSIARIENGGTTPSVQTMIKLLIPLGKTLKIVPIEEAGSPAVAK